MPSVLIITNVSPGTIYKTLYNTSLSVTCGRSVVISGYARILHQKKTDYQDITEILLKVALNTTTLTPLSGNKKITQKIVTVTKKKIGENSLIDHYC
jgi:hypothetical protein